MNIRRFAIHKIPDSSEWKKAGFTLPGNILDFQEQIIGEGEEQYCVTFVRWRPEKVQAKAAEGS